MGPSRPLGGFEACKFEKDLGQLVSDGAVIEARVVCLEALFLAGTHFTAENINAGATDCKNLHDMIKRGNKKASALRPWFKLS